MASSNFSGVIQINDLDDFIGPGLECIKPIPITKKPAVKTSKIKITTEENPAGDEHRSEELVTTKKAAKVNAYFVIFGERVYL
jgi:hypothetical protein